MRILVTGGAGFIGSHLVDALLTEGFRVRVLDNLDAQVHGAEGSVPAYFNPAAELQIGDVRDPQTVTTALTDIDVVFHLAAAVGVGQSMYQISRYVSTNSLGAAVLLQGVVDRRKRIRKMVVASSMSVYGEGACRNVHGDIVMPEPRSLTQLQARLWDLVDGQGRPLITVPTPESKMRDPVSIYAITKRNQEELFLTTGAAYQIPTFALRYFNTYGPRQALSNPYTGLLATVCAQLANGHGPLVFEDGQQTRDFVHVSDIVRANLLALRSDHAAGGVYNVGTGRAVSVLEVVTLLAKRIGCGEPPDIAGRYRAGDIRHCYADIARIRRDLGYRPAVTLEEGIEDLIPWVQSQHCTDHVHAAVADLERRFLVR
jgi:dTDP-L-rhamnose 4-epimerase